jgi:hypothetical protein
MVKRGKVWRFGRRLGVALPDDVVDRHGLRSGDDVLVLEADGGIFLAPHGSPFDEAFRSYEAWGRAYHDAIENLTD